MQEAEEEWLPEAPGHPDVEVAKKAVGRRGLRPPRQRQGDVLGQGEHPAGPAVVDLRGAARAGAVRVVRPRVSLLHLRGDWPGGGGFPGGGLARGFLYLKPLNI